jgi:hypothetical protein
MAHPGPRRPFLLSCVEYRVRQREAHMAVVRIKGRPQEGQSALTTGVSQALPATRPAAPSVSTVQGVVLIVGGQLARPLLLFLGMTRPLWRSPRMS